MDLTSFHAEVINLERASRLEAENYMAKAQAAREDLANLPKLWRMGWPELEERQIRDRITENEAKAKEHKRVADYAAQGYVAPMSDDHQWMAKHAPVVSAAHTYGRAKTTLAGVF